MLDPLIAERLAADDDAELWDVATNTILTDADLLNEKAHEEMFCRDRMLPALDQTAPTPMDGGRWICISGGIR